MIGSQDDFYLKHLTEKQVLGPILDILIKTLPRDNLLCSACLELFEFIKKENLKDLVKNVVENHREKLVSLSHFDTFRELIARFDQPPNTGTGDCFLEEAEGQRRPVHPNARLMEHIAIDPAEEEYWNTSDDEDGPESKAIDKASSNGASTPSSKPLVDYPSDEEADENPENAMTNKEGSASEDTPGDSTPPTAAPPERLSEKRRREEDDEDELGKLMQNKRRNSSSAGSNASLSSSGMAKRKKNLADKSSPSGQPKISISLSSSVTTGGNTRSDEES